MRSAVTDTLHFVSTLKYKEPMLKIGLILLPELHLRGAFHPEQRL